MPPKAKVKKDDTKEDGHKLPVCLVDPCDPWKAFDSAMGGIGIAETIVDTSVIKAVNEHIFEKDFVPKIRPFVIRATLMDVTKATCFHHYLQDECENLSIGDPAHMWDDAEEFSPPAMDNNCEDKMKTHFVEKTEFCLSDISENYATLEGHLTDTASSGNHQRIDMYRT
jgi:hypothetical protein